MKNLIYVVLFIILIVSAETNAQLAELWRKSYTTEIESSVKSFAVDNSGNFVIGTAVGRNAPQFANYVILKLNNNGDTLWRREYHSEDGFNDHFWDMYVDASGNIYATGLSVDYQTASTLRTVKYSPSGDLLWQRCDSTDTKMQNNGISKEAFIKEGVDGNIYVLTNRLGFLCLLKITPAGALVYDEDLDLPEDVAYMFARGLEINQHGIYMSSEYVDNINYKYHSLGLKCSSATGDTLWTWDDRMGNTFWEGPYGMKLDNSGNAYYLTRLMLNFEDTKMALTKINSGGGVEWNKFYGSGDPSERVIPAAINLDYNGNIIVAASKTYGYSGNHHYFDGIVNKYSSSGNLTWSRKIQGFNYSDVSPKAINITADNSIYISGAYPMLTSSSQFVHKFTASGDSLWNFHIDGSTVNYWSIGRSCAVDNNGNVYLAAERQGGVMLTKFGVPIGIQPISNELPEKFSLSQNYPNPFNPVTNIEFTVPKQSFVKLVVYDMLGHEVETLISKQLNVGTYKADWDASKYTSGIYFYRIEAGEYTETKKMILVK